MANKLEPFPAPRYPALGGFNRIPVISPRDYAKMAMQVGKVRSVLSGDTLVVTSIHNPTAERIVSLAYIDAPKLRKEGDEPWAFHARDFLRKLIVGKVINFRIAYQIPNTKREYGIVLLGDGRKLPEEVVKEGWAKIRDGAGRKDDTEESLRQLDELRLLEAQAKLDNRGIWSSESGRIEVQNELGDSQKFLDAWKGKTVDGIVERVLSGDRLLVRLMLSPTQHKQVMTLLAGIRAPSTERLNPSTGQSTPAEEFGNEAKQFVEDRLLQRGVKVDIVGVSPQNQLIATIKHSQRGSIALPMLEAGLARCTDNHSTMLGADMAPLRQAEKNAQAAKQGLFKGHVATSSGGGALEGIVTKVFSADTIYVQNKAGAEKRINLSSVRAPRRNEGSEAPFQDEAKEFLRKRLIGKRVRLSIDGSRPAQDGYEAKEVATVILNDKNIGLALVQEGWCSVIRHKRDDPDRAPNYDELLAAQEKAQQDKKGMWSGKPAAAKTYVDASESVQKAKMQLASLQRQKKIPAIVDFVKSGSRFNVLIPREGIKINFVLGGIRAPKSARNANEKSEPFGQEAHDLATRRCNQRDVEIDVHNIDKVGGFIGELLINRESFAKVLVEEGLATVHEYSAEQSGNAPELLGAQDRAKAAKKNIWHDYDPSQDVVEDHSANDASNGTNGDDTPAKRVKDYRDVMVTNIDDTGKLKLQLIGPGTSALESMMSAFASFHVNPANAASLPGPPKAGDFVAAKFSEDGQWYRARVRSNDRSAKESEVIYIDYGNSEKVPWSSLRPLTQPQFSTQKLKPQAVDAVLSLLQLPTNEQYLKDSIAYTTELTAGKELVANVDFTDRDGTLYVTLYDAKNDPGLGESINAEIVAEGLAMVPRKLKNWEKAYGDVLNILREKEKLAREEERRGMWEYGDLTED